MPAESVPPEVFDSSEPDKMACRHSESCMSEF